VPVAIASYAHFYLFTTLFSTTKYTSLTDGQVCLRAARGHRRFLAPSSSLDLSATPCGVARHIYPSVVLSTSLRCCGAILSPTALARRPKLIFKPHTSSCKVIALRKILKLNIKNRKLSRRRWDSPVVRNLLRDGPSSGQGESACSQVSHTPGASGGRHIVQGVHRKTYLQTTLPIDGVLPLYHT
jgi:hypothetical protein